MATRKKVVAGWKRNCAKIGKTVDDLPMMYVFVIIPAPERAQMIPRTYETLAKLGQQDGMTGQVKMIDQVNKDVASEKATSKQSFVGDSTDRRASAPRALPGVVETANEIDKPSAEVLERVYGLKLCVGMLNACEYDRLKRQWRYREIYIHSKLLLVDDSFFTLGSANLNQRSMAVDSEINIATNDRRQAAPLRKAIWSQIAGEKHDGGNCTSTEIMNTFQVWVTQMKDNKAKQKKDSSEPKKKEMLGFLVPLDDRRSSTIRLG